MGNEVDQRVHAGEHMYGTGAPYWREDGSCSYCGSMSPAEALRRMRLPGAHFSGTDKIGYKAYLEAPDRTDRGASKFYFRHLRELSDVEFREFAARARKVLGWSFERDGGEQVCWAPKTTSFYGWQTYGVIGPDGEPVHDKDAPKPMRDEWWAAQARK